MEMRTGSVNPPLLLLLPPLETGSLGTSTLSAATLSICASPRSSASGEKSSVTRSIVT